MKIVAIVGSLRKESFNRQLAEAAGRALAASHPEVEYSILDWSDVPILNEDIEHPAPESVARIRAEVASADGLWFFTPEHNHFFPAGLKNVIDWLSRPGDGGAPQVLAGKPAAIAGVGAGIAGTGIAQDHLVTLLSFLNVRVMNAPRITIPGAYSLLKGGKLDLSANEGRIAKQADALVAFIG